MDDKDRDIDELLGEADILVDKLKLVISGMKDAFIQDGEDDVPPQDT